MLSPSEQQRAAERLAKHIDASRLLERDLAQLQTKHRDVEEAYVACRLERDDHKQEVSVLWATLWCRRRGQALHETPVSVLAHRSKTQQQLCAHMLLAGTPLSAGNTANTPVLEQRAPSAH
jgi:hypothetical protein